MNLFVCIPKKKAQIEVILSCITFLKNGIYDHLVTFLITNKSEEPASEFLILYPFTFEQNADLYLSMIKTFKEFDIFGKEHEIDWNICERYETDVHSPFNINEPRSEGFSYRGLNMDGKKYHGWVSYSPTIERQNIGIELLNGFGLNGYSIFKVKFDDDYPLMKDMPHWVRIQFKVDCQSKGFLIRHLLGITGQLKYAYQVSDPFSVKNNFFSELDLKQRNCSEQENDRLEEVKKYLGHINTSKTSVSFINCSFYLRFKDIEKYGDIAAKCKYGNLSVEAIPASILTPCYKIPISNPDTSSDCKINIYAKESIDLWNLIKFFK